MTGRLLTAEDVAAMLGVPKSWVYEQSRLGRIPTVALGRYRRYRVEAIEAWIVEQEWPGRGRDTVGSAHNVNGAAPPQRPAPDTGR